MTKPQTKITPEELFNEATEGKDISSSDFRLLASGFSALKTTYNKPVNKIELNALYGMVAYVAHIQEVDETTVSEILTAHYGIADVKALPSRLYQEAIEYLVDLQINKVMN